MADDTGVKICQAIGVDYSQVVTSVQQMAKAYAELDTILAKTKASVMGIGTSANASMGAGFTSIQAEAKKAAVTVQDLGTRANQTKGMLDKVFATGATAHHLNFWWTSALLYGTWDAATEGIANYEKGLKGLSTTLPQLAHDQTLLNQAGIGLLDITKLYGGSLEEVMSAARQVSRLYKDQAAVMGLVDGITKLSIVDNVALKDSVSGVESVLAVWAKELRGTNEILAYSNSLIDSLTNLAHFAYAPATEMLSALERSNAAAKNAGMSLQELMGISAAALRATGLPGSNVGNFMKTLASQLSSPSKDLQDQLEKIGVRVHDMNGKLKDAYTLILDLSIATKNAKLSQEEINDALEKSSRGVMQYSKLAAVVGSFDEIVRDTALAINSQGVTAQMTAQQLDTLSRRAATLRNTVVELFAKSGDDGLRDSLKSIIDTLQQFVLGFQNVSSVTLKAGGVMLGLGLTMKVLRDVYISVSGAVETLITLKRGLATATTVVTVAEQAEAVAATEAATATKLLQFAISSTGIGLLITALTTLAGVVLTNYIFRMGAAAEATKSLADEQDRLQQQALQQIQHDQERISFVESMAQKHEELTNKLKDESLGTAELATYQKDLAAVDAALVSVLTEDEKKKLDVNNVTTDGISIILRYIQAKKDEEIQAKTSEIANTQQTIQSTQDRIDTYAKEIESLSHLADARATNLGGVYSTSIVTQIENPEEYKKSLQAMLSNAELMANVPKEQQTPEGIQQYITSLKAKTGVERQHLQELQKLVANDKESLRALAGSLNIDYAGGGGSPSKSKIDAEKESIKELTDALDVYKMANNTLQYSLEATSNALTVNQSKLDYLNEKVKEGVTTTGDYNDILDLLKQREGLLAQQQFELSSANVQYKKEIQGLTPQLDAAIKKYDEFKAAGDSKHMRDASSAVEQFQKDISDLSNKIADNTQKVNENNKALLTLAFQGYRDAASQYQKWIENLGKLGALSTEQQLSLLMAIDKTKMGLQEQFSLEEQIYSLRKKSLEELRDAEVQTIQDTRDAYKTASDAKIQSLQDELDLMTQQDKTEQELKDLEEARTNYAQAQLDLADAQQKLKNIQAEKNQRVYQNGSWTYQANTQDIADAEKAVTDAQTTANDAYQSLLDSQRKYQEERLQVQIDSEKKAQTDKLKDYDTQIKNLTASWDAQINKVIKPKWLELLNINSVNFKQLDTDTQTWLDSILGRWQSTYAQIQSMAAFMSDTSGLTTGRLVPSISMPTVGSPSSSTTNNNSRTTTAIDNSTKIGSLTLNTPIVTDGTALIRNLKQLAQ